MAETNGGSRSAGRELDQVALVAPVVLLLLALVALMLFREGRAADAAVHRGIRGTVTISRCTSDPDTGISCEGSFDSDDGTVHIDSVKYFPQASPGMKARAWVSTATSGEAHDGDHAHDRYMNAVAAAVLLAIFGVAWSVLVIFRLRARRARRRPRASVP